MPKIKIGEPNDFKNLPNGDYEVWLHKYDAPVIGAEYDSSRLMFTVRDDLPEMEEFAGENAFSNIRTTWGWLFNALGHACGIPKETEFDELDEFLALIKGKSLKIKVKEEEYNGKTYSNIKGYFLSEEAPYDVPVDDDDLGGENSII